MSRLRLTQHGVREGMTLSDQDDAFLVYEYLIDVRFIYIPKLIERPAKRIGVSQLLTVDHMAGF